VVAFIKEAVSLWKRSDIVSIAYTAGAREGKTKRRLQKLSRLLKTRLIRFGGRNSCIKGRSLLIKVHKIDLSPVSKASILKNPWDGTWFKEDYCRGPGNIFFVMPDGSVKPCCGYATDRNELTIGNIRRDSARAIIRKARMNRLAFTIFNSGLSALRHRLEAIGVRFPGKTSDHCYFCNYVMTKVPRNLVEKCLD